MSCHLQFCCPQSSILALVLTVTTSAKRWKQLCKLRAPSINRAPRTEYKREFKSAKCATAQFFFCTTGNCTVHQEPRKVLLHNCQGVSKRPAAAPRTHLNAAANRLTTKESWRKVRLRAEKRSKPCWELELASKIFATPSLAMFVKFRFNLETNLLLHKSNGRITKGSFKRRW